jgi:predicted peptidase
MIDAGAEKVSLLIYDGVGHNSWERTYKNMTLYDWLLNQSK